MASRGVLNPRPTSLYQRFADLPALANLDAVKTCGCFWKARSDWTVSSVAIVLCDLNLVIEENLQGILVNT